MHGEQAVKAGETNFFGFKYAPANPLDAYLAFQIKVLNLPNIDQAADFLSQLGQAIAENFTEQVKGHPLKPYEDDDEAEDEMSFTRFTRPGEDGYQELVIGEIDLDQLKSSTGNDDTIFKVSNVKKDDLKEKLFSEDEIEDSEAEDILGVVEHIQKTMKIGLFKKIIREFEGAQSSPPHPH
eukprot:Platyproteum_vivax@DN5932_c1_g1_i1.p1